MTLSALSWDTSSLRARGWYAKKWSHPKKLLVTASATVAGNRQMADYLGIILGLRGGQDALFILAECSRDDALGQTRASKCRLNLIFSNNLETERPFGQWPLKAWNKRGIGLLVWLLSGLESI
jgi:hypothetical protein